MQTTIKAQNLEWSFEDSDIVNVDDFTPMDQRSIYDKSRGWLLHDHGITVCVVFADSLQDALDIACDEGKLTPWMIPTPWSTDADNAQSGLEWVDYLTDDPSECAAGFDQDCPEFVVDGKSYWWRIEPTFLGNASEPHDIETLGFVEFDPPAMSVVRLCGESIDARSFHVA